MTTITRCGLAQFAGASLAMPAIARADSAALGCAQAAAIRLLRPFQG